MNRIPMRAAAIAALLCAAVAGCSQKEPAPQAGAKGHGSATHQESAAPQLGTGTTETAAPSEAAAPQGGEVQIAGVLGCGHCNFHVTPECAAVVKTAAGEMYVIDGVKEGSELWEKRMGGDKQIVVTGTVLDADKIKHVAMTSFEFKI